MVILRINHKQSEFDLCLPLFLHSVKTKYSNTSGHFENKNNNNDNNEQMEKTIKNKNDKQI